VALLQAATGGRFLTAESVTELARRAGPHLILALGQALVILTGGIDLSVGALAALSSMVLACALSAGWPLPVAIASMAACPLAAGALHAVLVASVRVPAFVATLGSFCMARSLAEVLNHGTPMTLTAPDGFDQLYYGDLLGVPLPMAAALLLFLATLVLTRSTLWGRRLYAVGGNESASFLSGVPLLRTHVFAYLACGVCVAIAALIWTAKQDQGDPGMARTYELYAVASAVIGGVSLKGGRGSMVGVLLGTAVVQVLHTAQIHLQEHITTYWRDFLLGFVLVGAVASDALRRGASADR
jgi:ribose transport system permease protein